MMLFRVLLILFSLSVFSNENWKNIQLSYDYFFGTQSGREQLVSGDISEQIQKVDELLKKEENQDFLQTEEGKKFLIKHQKFKNYKKVKTNLDKCQNNKESKRKLDKALLLGMISEANRGNCYKEELLNIKSLFSLNQDISEIDKKFKEDAIEGDLIRISLKNSLVSLIKNKFRYDPDFLTENLEGDKKFLFDKICGRRNCNDKEVTLIQSIIDIEVNQINKNHIPKQTSDGAISNINESIDRLNSSLDKVSIPDKEGIRAFNPFASIDLKKNETQSQFTNYLKTYMEETSKEDGMLMHTKSLRFIMGKLKALDKSDLDGDTTILEGRRSYKLDKHRKIDAEAFKNATREMFRTIDSQISKLNEMRLDRKRDEQSLESIGNHRNNTYGRNQVNRRRKKKKYNNIDFLVKTNPKAVSEILSEYPNMVPLVCDSLIRIDEQDKKNKNNGKLYIWGGIALGIAGIFTGGAAWALAGTLSAGGIATAGVVTTALVYGSMASGLLGTSMELTEAYQMKQEAQYIEDAIFVGSEYESSEFRRDMLNNYKQAWFDMAFELGLPLGANGVGLFFKAKAAHKLSKTVKGSEQLIGMTADSLEDLTQLYRNISKSKKLQNLLKNTIAKLGPNAADMIQSFFMQLAHVSPSVRAAMLEKLAKLKANDPILINIVRKTQCK